jgi:hypothetical protein
LSAQAAEADLTEVDHGQLDIAQTFRRAGLGAVVAAGEAAEPAPQLPVGVAPEPPTPTDVAPANTSTAPSTELLSGRLPRPDAELRRRKGRLVLILAGRPLGISAQVRLLGHEQRSGRRTVLQTLTRPLTTLMVRRTGTFEVAVRYIDPYDLTRTSPWTRIMLPGIPRDDSQAFDRRCLCRTSRRMPRDRDRRDGDLPGERL